MPQVESDAGQENIILGMSAAVGAYFLFSVMVLFAKLLSVNHSVIEIAFYRNLTGSVLFLFIAFALGRRDILVLRSKPVMVGVGLSGSVAQWLLSVAYKNAPAAVVTVFNYSSIVWRESRLNITP